MIYSFNGIRDDFGISVRASKALIILSGSADPMENDYGFELQYSSTFGNDLHSGCTSKETCISFNKSIAHVGDEGNTNADYKKENDFVIPTLCPPFYFGGKRCEIINCQNIRMDSKSGFIVSPGYPNEYLSNLNCSWIFALNETTMEYSFQSLMFNVEGPQNLCSNDYLEFDSVEDHSRKMRHCGVLESAPLQLEYPNPLIVRFVTDEDVEEDGFFINYRHEMKGKCNETLKNKYGKCSPLRCAASPCLNGGTCIENMRKNIHCKCPQYYGGQFVKLMVNHVVLVNLNLLERAANSKFWTSDVVALYLIFRQSSQVNPLS
ncbi:Cubilin [Trichinella spiralis]|uniref:Cubilin n=1 Tax=Trichinella spiralis TaxID=6334 RepID=A0ABR3K4Y8_TRISP